MEDMVDQLHIYQVIEPLMVELFELLMVQIELSNIQIKKFFDYEPVTSLSIPPLDHIFAVSVIYQVIEEQPEYPEEYPHSAVQQSIASKDQKGKRRKQPDAMFLLWQELNDGMYWTHKGCKMGEGDSALLESK
ncbi:10711_t:CDS:2 [Entrophospora sp. SA101]|nr:10711_t:CDS:2 [Entrophospora sp. SA101]